ncbi:MAG: PKD domain-containing protein [Halobacteriota archaeon]
MNPLHRCVSVALLLVVVVSVIATPPSATAQEEGSIILTQGDQCIAVEPFRTDEDVESFYEYRHRYYDRDDPRWGRYYSSEGTVEYQQDDTSLLMVHEGPDGLSLVIVHDKLHTDRAAGTTGGSATFYVDGLPEDGEWAVLDDSYGDYWEHGDHDDNYGLDDSPALLSWVWTESRTDGAAFRGLDRSDELEIQIEPAFNLEAYHRYGDSRRTGPNDAPNQNEGYNGTIDEWHVLSETEEGFERVQLDSLTDEVTVEYGFCEAETPINASVTASDTIVPIDQSVTFDVSIDEPRPDIETYAWDLTGDGTIDRETTDPSIEHAYETAGSYAPTVHLRYADGTEHTATTYVTNVDSENAVFELENRETILFDDRYDGEDGDGPYTYRFEIPAGTFEQLDSNAETVTLYAYDELSDEWVRADTSIETADGVVSMTTTVNATHVAVGSDRGIATAVLPADADRYPDLLEIERSTGETPQERHVKIDGEIRLFDAGTVPVENDRAIKSGFDRWVPTPGTYDLYAIEPADGDPDQLEIESVTADPNPATVGEQITVTVRLNNTGLGDVRFESDPTIDGEAIGTSAVTLSSEDTRVLTYYATVDEPGTYTVSIGDETTTVAVESTETSGSIDELFTVLDPVWGVLVVFVLVLSIVVGLLFALEATAPKNNP